MLWIATKCLVTAGLVVLISEVAKRSDRLGSLVASLPLVTLLTSGVSAAIARTSGLGSPLQIALQRYCLSLIHLIMDNYGTHKTAAIRAWFARRPRFHVHFTPTSASWINQVERWFATLTQSCIRRGTHRSTRQLKQAIEQYLKLNNADPKPFVWTKTADDILASIKRFCLRISETQH